MPSTILGPEWQPCLLLFFSFLMNNMFFAITLVHPQTPNDTGCKVTLRVFGCCTLTICYPPISPRCSTPRCILAQSQILVLTTCCFHLGHIVPWLAGWTHWSEGWATPGEPSFNPRNRGLEGQGPPTTPSALGLTRNNLDMAMDF